MRRTPRSLTRRGDDGPFRLPLQVVCAPEQRQFRLQRLVLLRQIPDRDHGLILQIDHALNDWRKCEGYAEYFFSTPMPKPPGGPQTPTPTPPSALNCLLCSVVAAESICFVGVLQGLNYVLPHSVQ